MIYIYPYNKHSESAKLLAQEMNVKRLKKEGSKIPDTNQLTIINWGAGRVPFTRATIINAPRAVAVGANKLRFFQACAENKDLNIPKFTTDFQVVRGWLDNGFYVCSRAVLDGNSGEGLIISNVLADLPTNSPLYTRYRPKDMEFRVHVVNGHVIRVQKKVYPTTKEKTDVNWKIRNHDNGFIFQIALMSEIPRAVLEQAVLACSQIGLDFAGVDVIWANKSQLASVLEVNCAPGIEGGTVKEYSDALKDLIRIRNLS